MIKKTVAAVTLVIGLSVGVVACTGDHTQLNDAPVGKIDDSPAFVMTNPDLFPNIAFRCLGKNGLYTTTRGDAGALHIVANDPQCGGDPQLTVVSG